MEGGDLATATDIAAISECSCRSPQLCLVGFEPRWIRDLRDERGAKTPIDSSAARSRADDPSAEFARARRGIRKGSSRFEKSRRAFSCAHLP